MQPDKGLTFLRSEAHAVSCGVTLHGKSDEAMYGYSTILERLIKRPIHTSIGNRESEYHEKKIHETVKIPILEKSPNVTFLEAYNCDSSWTPKPKYADRAKKQIYRTDYVLNHFVHYATVTKPYMETYRAAQQKGKRWQRVLRENFPSERVTDEVNEAVMIHTKIVTWKNTRNTEKRCHKTARANALWRVKGCYIGYPSPNGTATFGLWGEDEMTYNCFINNKVEEFWLPKLKERLERWQ